MKSFLKLTQYTMTAVLTLEKLTMGSLFSMCLPSYGLLSTREVRVTTVTLGPCVLSNFSSVSITGQTH